MHFVTARQNPGNSYYYEKPLKYSVRVNQRCSVENCALEYSNKNIGHQQSEKPMPHRVKLLAPIEAI